jgi:hypothetical protein
MALQGGRSSDYQHSSDLYEDSMAMLEACLVKNDDHPYVIDLRVVILNNAGHIYLTDRINFTAANQCFEAVCGLVEVSAASTGLPEEDLDHMMTNVLMKYSMSAPMA